MINLAGKITSQTKWRRIYLISRALLYGLSLIMALFLVYQILFPEISLSFFFNDPKSLKNTLVSVRTATQTPLENGLIRRKEKLAFNANPLGNFENATLKITTVKNSNAPTNATVKIRKTYSAFFSPEGLPFGFADGSLLSANGNYYLISDGTSHQFISTSALTQLGFTEVTFLKISPEDLRFNPKGAAISSANNYPDATLIVVGGKYYQFKAGQLLPFLSEKAFLSRYPATQAIPKDEAFLKDKTITENTIGFADGTLASNEQSVFILTSGKSYPFADSTTFVAMGFDWKDVLPVTPAELNFYTRQKQFTVNQLHPNGTLFLDEQTKSYFLLNEGLRRLISSPSVAKTYSKNSPILVNAQSLEKNIACQLTKTPLTFRTFGCELNLSPLKDFPGNDYQFEVAFPNDVNLLTANTIFYTKFGQASTLNSLSLIKTRLQNNYVKN
jgi:hypothetical protein